MNSNKRNDIKENGATAIDITWRCFTIEGITEEKQQALRNMGIISISYGEFLFDLTSLAKSVGCDAPLGIEEDPLIPTLSLVGPMTALDTKADADDNIDVDSTLGTISDVTGTDVGSYPTDDMRTEVSDELQIPKDHHRYIIGRKGRKLKSIELQTATKIHVPPSDQSTDIIKIMGTREGVDKARHQLQRISNEQASERLEISRNFHPFITGANNTVVKSISKSTGARINIPLSVNKNEITVAGDKECVAKAVSQIMKMTSELKQTVCSVSMEVRKSQHKYIVGPRGRVLQEILENTGVWVEVPPIECESNIITVCGPQKKIRHALTLVYEKANSICIEEVYAPQWLHRFIIGRKGRNVRKITQNLPRVHVEFNSDNDKIILEGPPEQVQQAKEAFVTFTENLMATKDYAEIKVDQKYHRHIIGKGGASVSHIRTETGTSIIIPPDMEKSDIIRIEGDPVGVQAAKTMLLEMAANNP